MPRTSRNADEMAHVVSLNPVEVIPRLEPPAELAPEERDEFVRIVNVQPSDWFRPGNLAALVQYCRHVIVARRVAEQIEAALAAGGENVEELLRAQVAETGAILRLMTALRLTPRATEPRSVSVKRLTQVPIPWGKRP